MIEKGITYDQYRTLIDELLAEQKTTGENHSEAMRDYTRMNVHRMNKWDKTVAITEDLQHVLDELDRGIVMITFTEAWCGDAAHNVPVIEKMSHCCGHLEHHILLRDEHEEAFAPYHYNGTLSIPRTVFFDQQTGEELAVWGPRPEAAQQMVEDNKRTNALPKSELSKQLQLWYAKDKGETLQGELSRIIREKVVQAVTR